MSDFSRLMELAMSANAAKTQEALGLSADQPKPTATGMTEAPKETAESKRK